ncbi:HPr family phosphocarrier protein [Microbacterium sp. ARD32]|uniref:HPr family phosphocarrier protein n=1 Tax=Microbacterium sp. ARD32 TaxID=2962577 RepID=UPI0028811D61|nr:HPr family phosphocarrier protein [Microbacterium sp. ARD32]MDT0158661.1 HPr family phosphocarrier protein [Microbacterium sp. ARD32]
MTLRRRVTVGVDAGAHARPVAELARLALAHGSPVVLTTRAGEAADLTSVLAVMDLAIGSGDEVVFEVADSPGAAALLDALEAVLSRR